MNAGLVGPSASPEVLEPRRRQFGVAHRMLDIAVAEVGLQGAGIMSLVCQCVAASVPEHVRVGLEGILGGPQSSDGELHRAVACR